MTFLQLIFVVGRFERVQFYGEPLVVVGNLDLFLDFYTQLLLANQKAPLLRTLDRLLKLTFITLL